MRKEIEFTNSDAGIVAVAVYYDTENNEFDRVVLNMSEAYSQITDADVQEFIDLAKANLLADVDRIFNSGPEVTENTHNTFLKHTKTHQSLQLIKDYKYNNRGQ
jgi:hypothetical protein